MEKLNDELIGKGFALSAGIVKAHKEIKERWGEILMNENLLNSGAQIGLRLKQSDNFKGYSEQLRLSEEALYWYKMLIEGEYTESMNFSITELHTSLEEMVATLAGIQNNRFNAMKSF